MTESAQIIWKLQQAGAILVDQHFVYTSGHHGATYINLRKIAHHTRWMSGIARMMARRLEPYQPEVVIGPETLGRTFATLTTEWTNTETGIWCEIRENTNNSKRAVFPEKFEFAPLVAGKRVAIVDDLLNTGLSFRLVSQLVQRYGGQVVVACAPVCRTPGITGETCGAPSLEVLAFTPPMVMYTPEECHSHGPCSARVPMVLRPGHGWKWIKNYPGYPTA